MSPILHIKYPPIYTYISPVLHIFCFLRKKDCLKIKSVPYFAFF